MRQSEHINELAAALAKAQGSFVNPERNREVEVKGMTKSGKEFTYTFKYATFDAILDVVRGPLATNGLALLQGVSSTEAGMMLTTKLLHGSGQWIESDTPVFYAEDKAQAFGSGVSYAKRYAVAALLGITADEDDDGNNAEGNRATFKDRKPAPRSFEQGKPIASARREMDAGTASTVKPPAQPIDKTAPDPKKWAASDDALDFLRAAKADLVLVDFPGDLSRWVETFRWQHDAIIEHGTMRGKSGQTRSEFLGELIAETQDRCRATPDLRSAED